MPDAKFTGFADQGLSFFKKLAKHQDREWFKLHKAEYIEGWHEPMEALLANVRARVDDAFPYCELAPPKVFRVYKDTRFSKDKTPYKTHVAGILMAESQGATSVTGVPAALYMHVGLEDGAFAAHGQYSLNPEQLAKFRAGVLDPKRGAAVAKIARALEKAGFTLGAAETLKKAPRGIDPAHPRADLLLRKGLMAMGPAVPKALLTSPKLVDHLVRQTKKTVDLVTWLVETTAV
jgi:uncharacterized protein (TIGR02453 family)